MSRCSPTTAWPQYPGAQRRDALTIAAELGNVSMLEILVADRRSRRPPPFSTAFFRTEALANQARAAYDVALRAVKRPRNARFRGIVRAVVTFRRMRLRAAQAVYAPGGAGCVAAAESFNAAARDREGP